MTALTPSPMPARRGPSPAQITAAEIRSALSELEEALCALLPSVPPHGEPGGKELRDLSALIDLLLVTLDAHSECWDDDYRRREAAR